MPRGLFEGINFVSNHLGLEFELHLSQKNDRSLYRDINNHLA